MKAIGRGRILGQSWSGLYLDVALMKENRRLDSNH